VEVTSLVAASEPSQAATTSSAGTLATGTVVP